LQWGFHIAFAVNSLETLREQKALSVWWQREGMSLGGACECQAPKQTSMMYVMGETDTAIQTHTFVYGKQLHLFHRRTG